LTWRRTIRSVSRRPSQNVEYPISALRLFTEPVYRPVNAATTERSCEYHNPVMVRPPRFSDPVPVNEL
jgi:hypothetical protein